MMLSVWHQNKLVGLVGHQQPVDWVNRLGWMVFWLDSAAQGKGFATMAAQQLLDYSFNTLGLNKVEIRCTTDNERAKKMAHRLGFQEECVFRSGQWLNGKFYDVQVHGLLASEYQGGPT
jgi:ribosomal-protein-serine acetyltransferase